MRATHFFLIVMIVTAAVLSDAKTMQEADVARLATLIGSETGIEADLLVAIAKVESGFNATAIGKSHKERGLMQLHPRYFPQATFSPYANMRLASKYLVKLKKSCSNRGAAWYTCYNSGPNRTIRHPQLLSYFKKVEYVRRQLKTSTRYVVQD
jgi:soluble lytic murein transglycosylase-like protein